MLGSHHLWRSYNILYKDQNVSDQYKFMIWIPLQIRHIIINKSWKLKQLKLNVVSLFIKMKLSFDVANKI